MMVTKVGERELWELGVSVRLQVIAQHLELLSIGIDDKKYKVLSNIYREDLHVWAMDKILKVAEGIDRSGARVRVSQRKLDAIKKLTGIEAYTYELEANSEPDSKDCNRTGGVSDNDGRS